MTESTVHEDGLRQTIAKAIGYEMMCEGRRTGEDISYGVAQAVRDYLGGLSLLELTALLVNGYEVALNGAGDVLVVTKKEPAND